MNKWSFRESNNWEEKFPKCSATASRVAPINIDTSDVSPCHTTCKMAIRYGKTKCYTKNENSMPTVYFDPSCYCKFKGMIYTLKKMTIHKPSMHTINNDNYEMEVLLYHYLNPLAQDSGGVIISILFRRGHDYGKVNNFFNQFINQIPVDEGVEKEVEVYENWNPESLYPDSKSFFYYDGALPYPPCDQNWQIIVFEEIIPISSNIINTVNYLLGDSSQNIRDIVKKPDNITVFYNSYHSFEDDIKDIKGKDGSSSTDKVRKETKEKQAMNMYSDSNRGYLRANKIYIKGIILTVILVLLIFLALKIAKYLVVNDVINRMIVKQIMKKEQRNKASANSQAQANAMAGPM